MPFLGDQPTVALASRVRIRHATHISNCCAQNRRKPPSSCLPPYRILQHAHTNGRGMWRDTVHPICQRRMWRLSTRTHTYRTINISSTRGHILISHHEIALTGVFKGTKNATFGLVKRPSVYRQTYRQHGVRFVFVRSAPTSDNDHSPCPAFGWSRFNQRAWNPHDPRTRYDTIRHGTVHRIALVSTARRPPVCRQVQRGTAAERAADHKHECLFFIATQERGHYVYYSVRPLSML